MAKGAAAKAKQRPQSTTTGSSDALPVRQTPKNTIDKAGPAQDRMADNLEMIAAIMGGTKTMRAAGKRFLPQEAAETLEAFTNRLFRSTFFNGYKRSVHTLVGKPFSKPMQLSDSLTDAEILKWLDSVDMAGRRLEVFARDLFIAGLADGLVHILVDVPVNTATNLAEEKTAGIRPYFCMIDSRNIIAARGQVKNGEWQLTHLRYAETATVQDGQYVDKEVLQIRVLEPGLWETWQLRKDPQNEKEEIWQMIGQGTMSISVIPLVTVYTNRSGPMEATPPMMDLAYLNLQHWQSGSDQAHILHVARVPILFGKGFPEVDASSGKATQFTVSPNTIVTAPGGDADLKYVEHQGHAIGAGKDDLESIENRMAIMGAELLVRRQPAAAVKTATQTLVDMDAEYSDLAVMAVQMEDGLDAALRLMALWMRKKIAEGKIVTINKDFGISLRDQADLQALQAARAAGDITQKLLLSEFQRRGVIDPAIDVDDEIEAVRQEPPRLSAFEIKPGTEAGNPAYHAPAAEEGAGR